MSVLLYPSFNPAVNMPVHATGEFLGKNLRHLEAIAEESSLVALSSFGDNRAVPGDFDGPPWELRDMPSDWNEWFDPAEGVVAIRRLKEAINGSASIQDRLDSPEEVIRELEEFERELRIAQDRGCRFRLELSC